MATPSRCDLTKRAFKNLIRDVAERLEDKEVKDICWQMDLPKCLEEKPALEVMKWLLSHGKCSVTNAQPLVELFKDIHRKDLAERVENFQKEFGHSYSMPETSHKCTSHISATEMQAGHNMLFGNDSNCPASAQDDTPSTSGIAISKAQQETSRASHEESCSEACDPLSGSESVCSVASVGNAFLPTFTPPSGSYRKVSDASTFTLESSSASSSLLEMPRPLGQHPPLGMMWRFPSNSSSGISQENMLLHSSNSDIMDPNVMGLMPQYQPKSRVQHHSMLHQRGIPWYCHSSVASLSTPMSMTDQNHGSSNSTTMLHPRHRMSPVSRLPMCRSMSQDYHKPPHKDHYNSVLHRRHTFTPADRQQEKGTHMHQGAVQAPKDYSRASEVSKGIPQNQMCCAQRSTCQSCKPHTHCGQLHYPVHGISPGLRCPDHNSPITHHESSCSEKILKRGWESGEECIAKNDHAEQFPPKNDHTVIAANECKGFHHIHSCRSGSCNGMCQFDDTQSSNAESEPSVAIISRNADCDDNESRLKQGNIKKRNSVPVFRSQYLEQTHRQSLDVSTLKRGSACMSASSGMSNRSLTSVNTLIGSTCASNSKSPINSPGDAGISGASMPAHSVATVSQTVMSKWRPVSALFHTKPKSRLIEPNKLVWPVKRDKLNKYIYKHKTKLLRCKLNLELISEHSIGPSPKLSLQLHPYGAEEDSNKFITAKVSIELRRCRLHSDTRIAFTISAKEDDPSSGAHIGHFQEKQEQITKCFFYVKQFIDHQELKNSSCDYILVISSATLIMPSHH